MESFDQQLEEFVNSIPTEKEEIFISKLTNTELLSTEKLVEDLNRETPSLNDIYTAFSLNTDLIEKLYDLDIKVGLHYRNDFIIKLIEKEILKRFKEIVLS